VIYDPLTRRASEPRLIVDLQTAQGGFFGDRGIPRYATQLTLALLRRMAASAVLFNPNRPTVEPIPSELRDNERLGWSTTPTLRRLDDDGATGYLITSPFEKVRPASSFLPQYVVDSGMPIAAVLYDLIPEIISVYPPKLMPGYRARREIIKHVDLVLALSDHTRRDAIERLGVPPERVVVIGAGASDFFRPPVPGDQPAVLLAERLPAVTKPFVLCVSGWLAHKNTEGLIDAWARLPGYVREAHQLVVACRLPPEAGTAWIDRGRDRGLRDSELVVTGYVDDEVLRGLYHQARLSVSPSFYEGFGLPALEAALCSCPAITSNTSALPEVLQWAPATFSPGDVDEMADIIERGLLDEEFRVQLLQVGAAATRRHTWERVADRVIAGCTELTATPRSLRGLRRRVALVGGRAPCGRVHDLSDELARRLRHEGAHVDCFATFGAGGREPHRRELAAFGRTVDPWGYDAVVYLVDEATPAAVLDMALRYPGIVWFLVPPAECPDAHALGSAARARLVSPDTTAPNGPAQVAPFARPAPTRTASLDDPERAAASLLELMRELQ
jgi:glycosyltransferase involved in cell wall biosynthesis